MKQIIHYPSIDVTHTYIGFTADEVESMRDEVEEDIKRKYGMGWNEGYEVLYDDTDPILNEDRKIAEDNGEFWNEIGVPSYHNDLPY